MTFGVGAIPSGQCRWNAHGLSPSTPRTRRLRGVEHLMAERRPCRVCGKPAASKGYSKGGYAQWRNECSGCYQRRRALSGYRKKSPSKTTRYHLEHYSPRARYLKDCCEYCGFTPEVIQQLHLDHIDGDRANNEPSNLQTLCANCHARKTVRNGDYLAKQDRPHTQGDVRSGNQINIKYM